MRHLLAVLVVAAGAFSLGACRGSPAPSGLPLGAQGNGQPPNPVYLCDGITGACQVLGVPANPISVTGSFAPSTEAGATTVTTAAIVPLNSTGTTPSNCLTVCDASAGGCHLTRIVVNQESNVLGRAGVFNASACPTAWTGVVDTFPIPAGPPGYAAIDDFGAAGLQFDAGCTVAISSTGLGDGGGGVGSFTAAALNYDITGMGYRP